MREALAAYGQALPPMLELIDNAQATIDVLMHEAARGLIEQLLIVSAQEVAGPKYVGGAIGWHGPQRGCVTLAERRRRIERPRLRRKDGAGEVVIPAYTRKRKDKRLAERVRDIVVAGVSTRKYQRVLCREHTICPVL